MAGLIVVPTRILIRRTDVLNWDQSTYMPEGGAGARGRQRAMLNRLAHERAVEPALGRLIDELAKSSAERMMGECVGWCP